MISRTDPVILMFIAYDDNGMPRRIQFADGNVTEYVYTATGRKLRTIYYTAVPGITVGSGETHQLSAAEILSKDSIDYFGNLIMENGAPKQYLFPGGYCSLNGGIGWHYYNQDHLGNNREVVNESGTLEQVTNYYPFGAPFCEPTTAGVNTNTTLQRYKYNGKELDLMHGLKWYDYGARMYDPILLTWNSIDPLCENYYNISPYAYCANNPVMYIDPTGMDYWSTNDPNVISEFLNNLKNFGFSNLDYKKWHHTTDADFLANLSYNDQTNKYYYSHGTVENGEVVCYSKTFDLDNITDTKWWNSIGQYNTDIAAATGAAEYKLGNSYRFATAYTIHDNRGNVLSTSKPKVRIPNTKIEVDAKMVGKMAKGARILGYGTGILSGIITGKEILYGEKDIIGEGGIDLIMTGVGFVGPYGWVFSSAYFLGKYALE